MFKLTHSKSKLWTVWLTRILKYLNIFEFLETITTTAWTVYKNANLLFDKKKNRKLANMRPSLPFYGMIILAKKGFLQRKSMAAIPKSTQHRLLKFFYLSTFWQYFYMLRPRAPSDLEAPFHPPNFQWQILNHRPQESGHSNWSRDTWDPQANLTCSKSKQK